MNSASHRSSRPLSHPDAVRLWSATPTPFNEDLGIDFASMERVIEHHTRHDIEGVMLGGSCGEGPWMPVDDLELLVRHAVDCASGRMKVAAQVTDNSVVRMLRHIDRIASAGADCAVIAAPYFLMNATPARVYAVYRDTIEMSPIPIIFYNRGKSEHYQLTDEFLEELLLLPNLVMIKDSSRNPTSAAIERTAVLQRKGLAVMTGDEFNLATEIADGMEGGFLGGAIFNAPQAGEIIRAAQGGRIDDALALQATMNDFMLQVYGGIEIRSWLSGLKYFLKRLGLFTTTASYLEYPLADMDRAAIDRLFETDLREQFIEPLLVPRPKIAA